MVVGAVVAWEEVSFCRGTGRQHYLQAYASVAGTPSQAVGLLDVALAEARHDLRG